MDFGPFGFGEVVFIALLALVIFGPRRLPEIARSVGRVTTALRRGTEELKRTFQEEMDAADAATRDVRAAVRDAHDAATGVQDLGRQAMREVRRVTEIVPREGTDANDRGGPAPAAEPASTPAPQDGPDRADDDGER